MDGVVVSMASISPQIRPDIFKLGSRVPQFAPSFRCHPLPLAHRARSPCVRRSGLRPNASSGGAARKSSSPWDDAPFELLPGGRRSYLDEQDVVSFLDPPKELIPIDPASFNAAAYLWKKIGDIPEERRHRLLHTVKDRLVSRLWELAGTRYQDSKLAKKSASDLLSLEGGTQNPEVWNCRTSQGGFSGSWINDFKTVLFSGKEGDIYGRIILGGSIPFGIGKHNPLYFEVRHVVEVMSTEQPCDLAYEFGDGLLNLQDLPEGLPNPAKHPSPFDDHFVIYVRHAGPGVLVAQAWQEGKDLEQVPKKFCSEILMVKDYSLH